MSLKGKIEIVGLTDTGRVRDHNEDQIGADADLGVAILADGMGGLKAGEVASAMAVQLISSELQTNVPDLDTGAADEESGYSVETLAVADAVRKANATIHQVAQTQPQCAGMGTTVVVLIFYDDRLTVAHVGDSRLYRFRQGALEQVTADHSLIQELVDRGFYTKEEARKAHNKNIVTRALGIEPGVDVDVHEDIAIQGDIFLLCSDGLNDMVLDEDIEHILGLYEDDPKMATQALVDLANANGGRDNVSVMLAKVLRPFPVKSGGWFSRLLNWFD